MSFFRFSPSLLLRLAAAVSVPSRARAPALQRNPAAAPVALCSSGRRTALVCVGVTALASACAQLVGITETEVETLSVGGMSGAGGMTGVAGASANPTAGSGPAGTGGSPNAVAGTGGTSMTAAGGTPSASGSGGAPLMASDAGPEPACGGTLLGLVALEPESRCGVNGREVCTDGVWEASPCPLATPSCENGECISRGPVMVAVPALSGTYFIDSTEVTVAQYRAFFAAKGADTGGQIAACSWNSSYYEGVAFNPDDWPMTDVDWCDAYAYCAWANKRLCGRIGGGPIEEAELANRTLSQWYLACAGPNGADQPNANATCNLTMGFGSAEAVGSFPGCEGYYPGVFDMLGNVAEWVDSCSANVGPNDLCFLSGGSTVTPGSAGCSYVIGSTDPDDSDVYRRSDKAGVFGFRCCSG